MAFVNRIRRREVNLQNHVNSLIALMLNQNFGRSCIVVCKHPNQGGGKALNS